MLSKWRCMRKIKGMNTQPFLQKIYYNRNYSREKKKLEEKLMMSATPQISLYMYFDKFMDEKLK